jgi:NitT/TauT family transport system substrate-binding protein
MSGSSRPTLGTTIGVALAALLVFGLAVWLGGRSGRPDGPGGTTASERQTPATETPTTPGATGATPAAGSGGGASGSGSPTKLTVGLGFIPSVQFAQFYRAQQAGYYRDAGLDVTFENKIDPELITLVGRGTIDVGLADGTSVIPAVSQGIPVRYAATIYAKFPNIVFARASSGIRSARDLEGKRVGTPGTYGSSWVMLQALLSQANLTTSDVSVRTYPDFTQAAAVVKGQVDAATGFVNNEPVQLQRQGIETSILRVDDVVPLPGNGLIVGQKTLDAKADALRAFVAATLRAQDEVASDPKLGLDAATAAVPELASDTATQEAILAATIDTWSSDYTKANGAGAIDRDAWAKSIEFMSKLPGGLVPNPVSAEGIITTKLLPAR